MRNDNFFAYAIKRNRTSAILGCKLLVAVFKRPPISPVLLPALVPPDFTKQSLVCSLLLFRSNIEATRVPACRERAVLGGHEPKINKEFIVRQTPECIFPGLNNAFGGVASNIVPCSQPAPLLVIRGSMAKCILAASKNAFGCALGAP